jgi:ubiquinone/menaquinone biosynthesis C-methylase UbiE
MSRSRRRRTRLTAALAVALLLAGCPPILVDRDGHRVFNPFYAFYLDADERDEWQQPERVLDALALEPGMTVADVGAGTGYFSERLARRVGPGGLVYATDVQAEMVDRLRERVREHALANVRVVAARYDDPSLPAACCDLVLFSSVYKEIDERVGYMEKVRRLLRPGGRVAILEYRPGAEGPGTPEADRLPPERVIAELAAAGLELRAEHDFLAQQYFLVFGAASAATLR